MVINCLADHKFLDWTKSETFADSKLNFATMMISLYDREENVVGKGENAGYQHFLLFIRPKGCIMLYAWWSVCPSIRL